MSPSYHEDNADDAALIARLRDGDPAALEALMRVYGERLIHYAARRVGSDDRAHEVIQDVFFALWRDRATLPHPLDVAAYLYWRTRNHAINLARAEQATHERERRWTTELSLDHDSAFSSDEAADVAEQELAIRNALADVPARSREVLLLVWEEKLSYAEVATVLGIAVPSVRSQMSRALKHLLAVLKAKPDVC